MIGDSINFPATSIAAGDRRVKIADNNSPLPRNRFYFGYNHYRNGVQGESPLRTDLDRFTFGAERRIFSDLLSVDLRIPFAAGLDASQVAGQTVEGTEFGNISLTFKHLLWENDRLAVSGGLGIVLPTAREAELLPAAPGPVTRTVDNEATYLQPFIGILSTPTDRWFLQGFAQWDITAGGYPVTTIAGSGVFQEQSLMYIDFQAGYWLYENPGARWITGIAPVVELHYTTTMQDTDAVLGVTNTFNRMDIINLTAGLHIEIGPRSMLTIAGAVPLRDQEEAIFDSELIVQFNRWF